MTLDNSMIIAGFTGMGVAISVMWVTLSAAAKKCETDREKLFRIVAKLTGDSELLERCPAQSCPFKAPHAPTPDHLHNPVPLH